MSLVRRFADFVCGLDADTVPAEVLERARICLLNGYGIGIGCHDTPYAPVARRAALALDGERPAGAGIPSATLLGDGRRTSVAGAILANAALFLASDEARFVSGIELPVDGASMARVG